LAEVINTEWADELDRVTMRKSARVQSAPLRAVRQDGSVDHPAAYDALASEYYDSAHVTSRNFDAATAVATADWRDRLPAGLLLEPGCGRGRAHEFLGVDPTHVVQMDNSPSMLGLADREPAMLRVLHDAEALPFPDGEFSSVAAFLCDGFLGLNFLAEANRVLKPGGILCGTTPSYEWGVALRELLNLDPMSTRFLLKAGGKALVPSFLYPETQLEAMLNRAGFTGTEIRAYTLPADTRVVSNDIVLSAEHLGMEPMELPILYSFWAVA
jgi:SAM-dependent methyltransferase